ncbi:MAG: Crp/Fnr family transcriptional regulator [Carboxylicivirga sp.]|jgi:CRP-like cAMP-binding protein|nr:Crp/Fnr family transcriptional regulator [Carboxylicivirga sp.]
MNDIIDDILVIKKVVNEFDLFRGLKDEELNILLKKSKYRKMKGRNILYYQDCSINYVILILKGIVKQSKVDNRGRESIIRFAKAGEIIGSRSLLCGEYTCTTSSYIGDAEVLYIDGSSFKDLVNTSASFYTNMMKQVNIELNETQDKIVVLTSKNVREKVANTILWLISIFGYTDDNLIKSPLTRKEIGSIIGASAESVIRTCKEFSIDNLLVFEGKNIRILDFKRLQNIGYSRGFNDRFRS